MSKYLLGTSEILVYFIACLLARFMYIDDGLLLAQQACVLIPDATLYKLYKISIAEWYVCIENKPLPRFSEKIKVDSKR